jgi:hypothetical protein
MAPQTDYVVVDPYGPCPCRSGKNTVDCCMAADGSFKVKFTSPLPSGAITGFAHANCYMRETRNCSTDVATGYYFSNGLRELLGAKVVGATFPWDGQGGGAAVGIEALPADILCGRHHDALETLDAVAIQAFRNILDAIAYVTMKSLATKKTLTAVSGEGLELWMLKLLFGAYQNSLTAGGGVAPENFQPLKLDIFLGALEIGALAAPRGFYIRKSQKDGGHNRVAADKTNRIAGLFVTIGPLECELIVDPTGLDLDAIRSENFYRPSGLDLIGRKRSAQIHLSGPGFATNETARLALTDARLGE